MAGGLGVLYGKDPLTLSTADQLSFAAQHSWGGQINIYIKQIHSNQLDRLRVLGPLPAGPQRHGAGLRAGRAEQGALRLHLRHRPPPGGWGGEGWGEVVVLGGGVLGGC